MGRLRGLWGGSDMLFELPAGWRWSTVAAVASADRYGCVGGPFGSNLTSKHYVSTAGVPVVRGQNMGDHDRRFIDEGFVFVTEEKADTLKQNMAYPGDLLFTQRGTLGQVAWIPSDSRYPRYVVSQSQMKLSVDPAKASAGFVYAFFRSRHAFDCIERNAITTGVPHINLGILRAFPLPLPPLPEQRRIAAILGALDDKIELNRKMNRTLEEMAQALFKSWFIDFDGHDDLVDSEIGPVPRGWGVKPIGDVVKVVGGSTPSTKEPSFWEGGTHAWATPKDLSGLAVPVLLGTERQVTDAGLQAISSGLLPAGTFLLSSRAPIGYTAISQVPTAINQGFIAIPPGGAFSAAYLLFWTRYNMDAIKGRAGGTTFAEISKSAFRPIPVVVPPPQRLAEFERSVGPLMERITANAREAETLATLRDTLLPKLISGELRVLEVPEHLPLGHAPALAHQPVAPRNLDEIGNDGAAPVAAFVFSKQGDLFASGADVLLNPVNCVGVMGKGLALAFRERFPKMFDAYRLACDQGALTPGRLHEWTSPDGFARVINFPTKQHWRGQSRLEWVDSGLDALRELLLRRPATTVAIPALGCGLGGLAWREVEGLIRARLSDVPSRFILFPPNGGAR